MTNRDLIMTMFIKLSPERFADMLNDQITELMDGGLCELCMKRNGGECPANTNAEDGCTFDLVAWLKEEISHEKLIATAAS